MAFPTLLLLHVYEYLHVSGAKLSMIDPTIENAPNLEVKFLIEEVLNIADSKRK